MVRSTGGGTGARPRTVDAWASLALAAITVAVFAPVRHFPFVSWDDPLYVTDNPVVNQGLTLHGVAWALTSPGQFYWHPLTWLSHMTDVQVFGLNAGGHHVTNLAFHLLAALLLYGVLRRMTGHPGRSAVVAALFAVHPLHVESVAWVAERKDVLSGWFWMLTLWAYVRYVRVPGRGRYAAVVACFALGLMSKPTLVALPLVLLLLDAWPLARLGADAPTRPGFEGPRQGGRGAFARLVAEKVPLFVLALAASAVTFVAALQVGGVQGLETVPVPERLSNAAVSAVRYVGMMFWPAGLATFYPFRPIPAGTVLLSVLILVAATCAAIATRRRRPYLIVGWLWYLVTLLPVIGLVQVGSQSMADRFTYLPLIGLWIGLTWGASDLLGALRVPRLATAAAAVALVAISAGAARAQVWFWKDSETLWRRAADAVPNNDLAHANLGLVLADAGRSNEALAHFGEALRIVQAPDPRSGTGRGTPPPEYAALLHDRLGVLLGRQGRWREAIGHFRELTRLRPAAPEAHHALGQALAANGELDEAVRESREAVRLAPGRAELRGDLASVLYRAGDLQGAMAALREALRLGPAEAGAAKWHYNLAAMLHQDGQPEAALRELDAALAINPAYEEARRASKQLRGRAP